MDLICFFETIYNYGYVEGCEDQELATNYSRKVFLKFFFI